MWHIIHLFVQISFLAVLSVAAIFAVISKEKKFQNKVVRIVDNNVKEKRDKCNCIKSLGFLNVGELCDYQAAVLIF